jgi:Homeodomain-like domain
MRKDTIELTAEQRSELEALVRTGQGTARSIQHAHILLKSDTGLLGEQWTDAQLREAYGVSESTVWRVRQRFRAQGWQDAVQRRPQPERLEQRKINGEMEAHLIALCCSPAPQGRTRWSVRLLADRFVVLEEETGTTEPVSRETIRRALKKTNSSRGSSSNGACHVEGEANG